MNILIIDDDVDINVLTKVALEANSHNVLQAYNGYDGLSLAKEHHKDLHIIILDIMMPDLDGFEVLKKLKENSKTKNIPVIFLSARQFNDETLAQHKNLIVKFISKPFELSDFVKQIEMIKTNN